MVGAGSVPERSPPVIAVDFVTGTWPPSMAATVGLGSAPLKSPPEVCPNEMASPAFVPLASEVTLLPLALRFASSASSAQDHAPRFPRAHAPLPPPTHGVARLQSLQ